MRKWLARMLDELDAALAAEGAAREAVALDALRRYGVCGCPNPDWPNGPSGRHETGCGWFAVLADPSLAAARLLAVVEAVRDSRRIREGREFFVSAEAYDEAIASAVEAIWRALRALDGEP